MAIISIASMTGSHNEAIQQYLKSIRRISIRFDALVLALLLATPELHQTALSLNRSLALAPIDRKSVV